MSEVSLENVLKQNDNIYASVVVMAKRARQVTDQQKLLIDSEKVVVPAQEAKENEDFDEVEIDREALMREHRKMPKPTTVAIDEMQVGKVHFEISAPEQAQ
jgi:DNA-directed RNA polymerase subunit K/omega